MGRFSLGRTLALSCVAVLLAASVASAAFDYREAEDETKPADLNATAALESAKGYSVTQLGTGTPKAKSSFGKDMALSRALKIITPKDWGTTAGPHGEEAVSWESEGTWIDALEQLGRKYGLRFVVDWKNRAVMVPAEGEVFADSQDAARQNNGDATMNATTVVRMEELAEMERPEKKWELEPGSLKKQLSEWTDRAGYSLVWNSKHDYQISADATFKGEFTKAVTNTVQALYRNGARISADIYQKNKVLYISSEKDKE